MNTIVVNKHPRTIDLHSLWRALGDDNARIDVDDDAGTFTVHSEQTKTQVDEAVAAHARPDHEAQFASAVAAIDTSKVTDPVARAALDAIKAVLTGGKGPGAEPRRPGR